MENGGTYDLPTTAFTFHGLSLHSEAAAPIMREKFENFNDLNVAFISYKLIMWD